MQTYWFSVFCLEILILIFYRLLSVFKIVFINLRDRESERESTNQGERQRERETQAPRWAGNPPWDYPRTRGSWPEPPRCLQIVILLLVSFLMGKKKIGTFMPKHRCKYLSVYMFLQILSIHWTNPCSPIKGEHFHISIFILKAHGEHHF